ncbi:acetyl-CoA acetyltransferase [Aquihabitans sp. G128]|uniref:acetyl-CoA acetyltransferase n=1 Tax=Aquihabitans sp. G128 TaxID=2849779 RepID=UPI001C21384F|nr:acetyl-CoA acetyltransferase [Aquihabitans sp. G128]QXC63173.1 acetyl-CoA acetyltransferase [Aquihabitans sp. G128]
MPAAAAPLDPRTPVVVAVGQVEQRGDDPATALEPTALLAQAARAAAADSGSDRLLASLDTIAVIRILSWRYRDPAALVAAELGISPRRTIETDDGGNYPQTLLNRACLEIQAGTADTVLIGGAEAWRTRSASRKAGTELAWTQQGDDVAPTAVVANAEPLAHPGEWARKVMMPIEIYPLFENALRAREGWTIDEHRDRLARLWAGFSEVAATNPHAWIQQAFSPAEVREATPRNRMVGFPYTKLMNANNAVEQAACFVVCSVERARELAIPTDRWVFPWAGTDAHEHWFVSNRQDLAEAPAIRLAGRKALELAGVGVEDLGPVDVYSCFPSAVQIAAKELGLGTDRPLTVTGGLSFAGGPWNNYVSHSIATMVERLRAEAGAVGLVTANGGFLTKHAFGVYSTTPPPTPYRHADLQPEVDALPSRELAEVVDEPATVETAVVVHGRDSQPERAIVATLLADGRRAWGGTTDPAAMAAFLADETHGRAGHVDPDGTFTFA